MNKRNTYRPGKWEQLREALAESMTNFKLLENIHGYKVVT